MENRTKEMKELCQNGCDALYCDVCEAQEQGEGGLTAIELANIRYAVALAHVKRQQEMCNELETLKREMLNSLCKHMAELREAEGNLKRLQGGMK